MGIHIAKIGTEQNKHVLEIKIDGKLSSKDYDHFVPEIEALMKNGNISVLLE
jgi:hypothetical protein